jgi:hypothetical protein
MIRSTTGWSRSTGFVPDYPGRRRKYGQSTTKLTIIEDKVYRVVQLPHRTLSEVHIWNYMPSTAATFPWRPISWSFGQVQSLQVVASITVLATSEHGHTSETVRFVKYTNQKVENLQTLS